MISPRVRRSRPRQLIAAAMVTTTAVLLTGCGQTQASSIAPSSPTPSSTAAAPSVQGSTSSTSTSTAKPSPKASAKPSPKASTTTSRSASPKRSVTGSVKPSQGATGARSATSAHFASAVAFTRAVFSYDYAAAAKHASPGSAASRYVHARASLRQAEKSNGDKLSTAKPIVKVDSGSRSIQIRGGDELGDRWSNFGYDSRGRVTGWNEKSGPVAKVTWSKTDKAVGLGLTATLTSAYLSNGSLYVVVGYKASAHVGLYYGGSYAVSGHSRESTRSSIVDSLAAHHSVSAYYVFKAVKLGGKITITATAASYTRTATLVLDVR